MSWNVISIFFWEIVPLELRLLGVLFKLEKRETIQTQGSPFLFQGTSSLDTTMKIFWHTKRSDTLWICFFFCSDHVAVWGAEPAGTKTWDRLKKIKTLIYQENNPRYCLASLVRTNHMFTFKTSKVKNKFCVVAWYTHTGLIFVHFLMGTHSSGEKSEQANSEARK